MKIAVFGGSFNPPHLAHLMACVYALSREDVDGVLMVPCARHPFGKPLAPFEHRLAMCKLAVEGVVERVEVSDIEAAREGVSYMIDTIEELMRRRPRDTFRLLAGSDITGETARWRDFDRLRQLAPPLVIPRLGVETLNEAVQSHHFVLPDISSIDIRERLARGDVPRELLPRRVADYIAAHGLYSQPMTE